MRVLQGCFQNEIEVSSVGFVVFECTSFLLKHVFKILGENLRIWLALRSLLLFEIVKSCLFARCSIGRVFYRVLIENLEAQRIVYVVFV